MALVDAAVTAFCDGSFGSRGLCPATGQSVIQSHRRLLAQTDNDSKKEGVCERRESQPAAVMWVDIPPAPARLACLAV